MNQITVEVIKNIIMYLPGDEQLYTVLFVRYKFSGITVWQTDIILKNSDI